MRLDLARTPAAGDLAVAGDELGGAARVAVFVDEPMPDALASRAMKRGGAELAGAAIDRAVPAGRYRATVWSIDPPLAAAVAALVLVAIVAVLVLFVLIQGGKITAGDLWPHLRVWGTAYVVLTIAIVVGRTIAASRAPQAIVELRKIE